MGTLPKNRGTDQTEEIAETVESADLAGSDEELGVEGNERGISETLDVLEAMGATAGYVEELVTGDLGTFAGLRALTTSLDDAYEAIEGANEIPAELGDLDRDEVEKLASHALEIVNKVAE